MCTAASKEPSEDRLRANWARRLIMVYQDYLSGLKMALRVVLIPLVAISLL